MAAPTRSSTSRTPNGVRVIGKDADGTPLALAWIAQQPGAFNFELQKLELAETADEAVAIAQAAGVPPQNFVVGDARRQHCMDDRRTPAASASATTIRALPADWSRAGIGWDGWLDARDYPLIANPPWQRLWTANQRMTEDPWLAVLGDGGYDIGARARQIRDDLRAHDHFTARDMLAIQLDDRALFLERWKDLLAIELNRAPKSRPHDDTLKRRSPDWNGRASIDSVGVPRRARVARRSHRHGARRIRGRGAREVSRFRAAEAAAGRARRVGAAARAAGASAARRATPTGMRC